MTTGEQWIPAWTRPASYAAAGLIAAGGYVHYCLYRNGYRFIPKIGVSFLLQVAASAMVAAALVIGPKMRPSITPLRRRQFGSARLAGVGLSLGTLGAFWLTRTGRGLFGFQERGLNPAPQALIALLSETMAATVLVALVVVEHRRRSPGATVGSGSVNPHDADDRSVRL